MFTLLKNIYALDLRNENILEKSKLKFVILNVLLFVIPLFLGEPQLLVGSIVNFILIYIAINYKQGNLLPAIFIPAIASILRNTLLGSLTGYLAILLPFIWMANGLFIFIIRGFLKNKKNIILSLVSASFLKAAFLFLCTFLLVSFFSFPKALLVPMGLLQVVTALIASTSFLVFKKVTKTNQ